MRGLPKKHVRLEYVLSPTLGHRPSVGLVYLFRAVYRICLALVGLFRAALKGGLGVEFHAAIAMKAVGLIGRGYSASQIYTQIANPMDSFRYFEFDFFWRCVLSRVSLGRYLDVSSPRLFNYRILASGRTTHAVFCNPDTKDLQATEQLFRAAGFLSGCELRGALVSELGEPECSFDTVTCISVLEHIPTKEATKALRSLWSLVKPGGSLLLSVPCAAVGFEEYIDFNEYGLLEASTSGLFFGQRFYDQELLDSDILSIVGPPLRCAVFGEKKEGTFIRNRKRKLTDPNYPFWMEALYMATQYCYFDQVQGLPGLGVVAYEFVKQ